MMQNLSQSVSSLDKDDEDTAAIRQKEHEMKAEPVAWEEEEKRERALLEQKEKSTPEKVKIIKKLNFLLLIL